MNRLRGWAYAGMLSATLVGAYAVKETMGPDTSGPLYEPLKPQDIKAGIAEVYRNSISPTPLVPSFLGGNGNAGFMNDQFLAQATQEFQMPHNVSVVIGHDSQHNFLVVAVKVGGENAIALYEGGKKVGTGSSWRSKLSPAKIYKAADEKLATLARRPSEKPSVASPPHGPAFT